jgi:hypothetical protein
MARIVGNLVPEDDYTHPLGPEPNFNESMYFNFFDRARGVGGFVRLGNRANEGRAEKTVTIFLPDGRVLFSFDRAQIDDNEAFDAGGLRFEVLEPGQTLRSVYEGKVLELAEPRSMSDPRAAFAESPRRRVALDLVHDAVGPMYGGQADRAEREQSAEQQFAKAHYEQHMAVEWLTLNFGDDLGAMVSIIRRTPESARVGGVVVRGMELDPVREATVVAEYEENGLYHRRVEARIATESGEELEIEGSVKGFIPLRNRRDGRVTHIGEGMTEWRCGDRVGYGLSEFLRQVR